MTKIQRGETTHLHHGICNTPYQANRALGVLSQMFNLAQQCGLRPLSEEAEAAILAPTLGHSTRAALRVTQELSLKGIHVSAGRVRRLWSRHKLLTKQERLLERFSPEFRERHIETRLDRRPGGRRHLLRRPPQGARQGVSAERRRLPFALRLGQALPQQDAGHRGASVERGRAVDLRGARARIATVLSDNGLEFSGRSGVSGILCFGP